MQETLVIDDLIPEPDQHSIHNIIMSQAEWKFLPRWSATAGLRHSRVYFNSKDYFIRTGNGNDRVFLANGNSADSLAVGRLFTLNGGNGSDSLTSANGTLDLRGFTSFYSVNTVNLAPATGGGISTVGMQITNPAQVALDNSLTIDGTNETVNINGSLGYSSNERADTVAIDGLSIAGTINLLLGNGTNAVDFSATSQVAIAGSLVVACGNNDDTLTLSDANPTTVDESVRISLGNGTNTVTIDNATIEGDISFKGGNGNDIINIATIAKMVITNTVVANAVRKNNVFEVGMINPVQSYGSSTAQ